MRNRKHDPSQHGLGAALVDINTGGLWMEPYRRRNQDSAAANGADPTDRRDSRQEPGAFALRQGRVQVQYLLKAWSEGHYAQVARARSPAHPYPEGSDMARAWEQGWQFGNDLDELIG